MKPVYLDWAATAPALPEAAGLAARLSTEIFGNPSSIHFYGEEARALLEDSRKSFADGLGCRPAEIFFTSGASESNNLVLLSLLRRAKPGHLVVSAIEHSSVYEPSQLLQKMGWSVSRIKAGRDGRIEAGTLQAELRPDTALVSIMHVNNETGAIQPVAELARVVRAHEKNAGRAILYHVDAVQSFGKASIDLRGWDADSAAFSAHKFRGPKGVGLLYARGRLIEALYGGGGQERGLRPGTENVPGIAAAALAGRRALERREEESSRVGRLMGRFLEDFAECRQCRILPEARRERPELYSPWIVSLVFPPLPGEVLVRVMSDKGFALSTGSACSSRKKRDTRVLEGMGVSRELAFSSLRLSLGELTTEEELQAFSRSLHEEIEVLFKVAR